MSPARQADPELDALIDEITVAAYDEDERLMGFENAFDEDAANINESVYKLAIHDRQALVLAATGIANITDAVTNDQRLPDRYRQIGLPQLKAQFDAKRERLQHPTAPTPPAVATARPYPARQQGARDKPAGYDR